jgi:CBS domain containing-hemolysin-like protein
MSGWLLVIAAVLIGVSAWCAGAQAALARLVLVGPDQHGEPAARPESLRVVMEDPQRYVSVLVLLRVICEVAATIAVTESFSTLIGPGWRAFLPALALMIVVRYMIIGVGPRATARQSAERVGVTAARILYPGVRLLGPLPGLLAAISARLPLGRRNRAQDAQQLRHPELRGLVDYMEKRSALEPTEREMVRSVFELGDTIVREVMVPRTDMVFIEREKTVHQGISLALRSGFSRIPVSGESTDDVVGMAYLKDLVAWERDNRGASGTKRVGDLMRPATYVPDSKAVDELLRQMQAERIHVAIVIDEYGGTAGLATIEDILEEIVGEIADEYDTERDPVEWLAPGTARVTARLGVDELAELFGVTIDAEDVETVGGLLAHELGRVPIAGSQADVAGLRLTVENLAGRRNKLGTVLVERQKPT